jgi:hypothetical protein
VRERDPARALAVAAGLVYSPFIPLSYALFQERGSSASHGAQGSPWNLHRVTEQSILQSCQREKLELCSGFESAPFSSM